ncbi:hypothetical protein MSG28_013431 [Choristoneura fumiferana]|uniref:Uncharacterized protein n=1 Tax=Choristoneura fumiferana TaxID=7141 RepID=A0ACC0KTG0_CHOFU|nr:hypothetical protein MSG28_013431 [Choristoneura fumiferana]
MKVVYRRKYSSPLKDYEFAALAVETMGPWSADMRAFMGALSSRLIETSGDPRAGAYLSQRISPTVRRDTKALVPPPTMSEKRVERVTRNEWASSEKRLLYNLLLCLFQPLLKDGVLCELLYNLLLCLFQPLLKDGVLCEEPSSNTYLFLHSIDRFPMLFLHLSELLKLDLPVGLLHSGLEWGHLKLSLSVCLTSAVREGRSALRARRRPSPASLGTSSDDADSGDAHARPRYTSSDSFQARTEKVMCSMSLLRPSMACLPCEVLMRQSGGCVGLGVILFFLFLSKQLPSQL